jgi:hypothetical protein
LGDRKFKRRSGRFRSDGSSHGVNNFTGLAVDITGGIRLIIGGADSGIFTTVAGFAPTVTHALSYQVNTAMGAGSISNIFLDGTSVTLTAPADTFTIARTVLSGFYNSDGSAATVANFDNFCRGDGSRTILFRRRIRFMLLPCASDFYVRRARKPNAKTASLVTGGRTQFALVIANECIVSRKEVLPACTGRAQFAPNRITAQELIGTGDRTRYAC